MGTSALQQALSGMGQQGSVPPAPIPESEQVAALEREILVLRTRLEYAEGMVQRLLNRSPSEVHNHYPEHRRSILRDNHMPKWGEPDWKPPVPIG